MALSPHSSARAAPGGPAVPGSLTPQRLTVHGRDDPSRAEVESFIGRVYASRHGAQVQHFAESLVALRHGNSIVAAAGYTPAGTAPLFLERYLSAPVQVLLAARTPLPVPRAGVVEVGHLAAERAGEGRRLIFLLAPHLASLGLQWVASTLTSELRQLFVRIGVTPHVLAAADPAALGPEARQWGSYYTHQPVVVAGHLPRVLQQWKSGGQA